MVYVLNMAFDSYDEIDRSNSFWFGQKLCISIHIDEARLDLELNTADR